MDLEREVADLKTVLRAIRARVALRTDSTELILLLGGVKIEAASDGEGDLGNDILTMIAKVDIGEDL